MHIGQKMRPFRLPLIFITLILSVGALHSQDKTTRKASSAESDLVDAVSLMQEGKVQSAQALLKEIISSDPSNDAAYYYLGTCHLYSRNLKEAQTALRKAVELDPGNFWYKERLAVTYSMAGEDDYTIATYEAMLKDFPNKDDIQYELVNLYLKQNQVEKALATMDKLELLHGKNENITATRYDILLRQNKPEEAFKTLADYNSEFSSPRILSIMGDHEMAEYKDSSALEHYREALSIQSNYAPALLGEAEVFRSRREYPQFFKSLGKFISDEDAIPQMKVQYMDMLLNRSDPWFLRNNIPQIDSLYDTMVRLAPSDSMTLASSAAFNFSAGNAEKTKSLLYRNMKAHPESSGANVTYIQLLASLNDWNRMATACDSALVKFPKETAFYELKNYAAYNMEDYRGIIDNCKKMISIAAGDTSKTIPALSNMGDMYYQIGEEKEAFKCYDKVLKVNPDYLPALNNYAWYLALKGKKLKKACAMSRKTVDKEPDNTTYIDTYAWILHLLGQNQEAKTLFKHAMLYGGKDSSTLLRHYAIVLKALGETDLADLYDSMAEKKEAEEKQK